MVGLKTLLVRTDSENATGEIIGFDINPKVEDYNKIVMVRGDPSLPCIILPDVNIRVNAQSFVEGKFNGDKLTGKSFLKREGKATRGGKEVTIFSLERVSAGKRVDLKRDEIERDMSLAAYGPRPEAKSISIYSLPEAHKMPPGRVAHFKLADFGMAAQLTPCRPLLTVIFLRRIWSNMASKGKFYSSYLIRCGDKMVGLKTLLVRTDSENATGEIIGFDINPKVEDYNKIVMVRGDPSLPCIILPDVNIRVNAQSFVEGKFNGDKLTGKSFLKREGKATRGGKEVTIFSLERVSAGKRVDLKRDEIERDMSLAAYGPRPEAKSINILFAWSSQNAARAGGSFQVGRLWNGGTTDTVSTTSDRNISTTNMIQYGE